jgi:hypothetical protein
MANVDCDGLRRQRRHYKDVVLDKSQSYKAVNMVVAPLNNDSIYIQDYLNRDSHPIKVRNSGDNNCNVRKAHTKEIRHNNDTTE